MIVPRPPRPPRLARPALLTGFLVHGLAVLTVLAVLTGCLLPGTARSQNSDTSPPISPPVIEAVGGTALLGPDTTLPLPATGRYLARIAVPDRGLPVLGDTKTGPGHQLLRRLFATGQAAGNIGDLYDNRDRGHSRLPPEAHPQLTHLLYADAFRKRGLDYGLAQVMLFDAPVIGNSSTAWTSGAFWRSQPRSAMTAEGGTIMTRLYQNYTSGQIDVYPEHRDHDPERGDLFPANTPYMLISQGSSGSDQPHLEALAMILAAFRPDTKAALRDTGLLAATVQMVYRRARVGVRSQAAYLSGAAHPSVFGADGIDLARMVSLANTIRPDTIPPLVRLKVLEETRARQGIDYFGEGLSEVLFDTPSAIARVWRTRAGRRSLLVSAADTRDPNGRALRFHWVLLRGDPDRTRITPLPPDNRQARIEIDWQDPRPVPGSPGLLSRRVDIGVFADNGVFTSAPAFVSVLLPRHETRQYAPGPDGIPQPVSIDRAAPAGVYADPALFPAADWRDVYRYDRAGRPAGWTRHRDTGTTRYDAAGRRLPPDGDGGGAEVRYRLKRSGDGRSRIVEQRTEPPE